MLYNRCMFMDKSSRGSTDSSEKSVAVLPHHCLQLAFAVFFSSKKLMGKSMAGGKESRESVKPLQKLFCAKKSDELYVKNCNS